MAGIPLRDGITIILCISAAETGTPADPASETAAWRKRIEPWLSAVFQAEHLSLLLGNGFTTAVVDQAGGKPIGMGKAAFGCASEDKLNAYAGKMAAGMGRGEANIEDQLSAALALLTGLKILEHGDVSAWEAAIDRVLGSFIKGTLRTEKGVQEGAEQAFGFRGPGATRSIGFLPDEFCQPRRVERAAAIFTTNYDRLIERGCDLAGLRIVDQFVGAIEPEFSSSRLQIDMHYAPPGIRGEPRHLEGVVHLSKLHGSLDWRYQQPRLYRTALSFGADDTHPAVPTNPRQSVMIYPNAAKDVDTASYPYADLFRDFVCRLPA